MAALKFAPHLRELRIHLCQKSDASKGVRDFIQTQYVPLKTQNPKFPILIRECSGIQPVLYARYGFGREISSPLAGLSAEEIAKKIKQLASKPPEQ